MRKVAAAVVAALVAAGTSGTVSTSDAQPGPAFFVRSLQNPADRREARPDILDTPVLPGSVIKAVTLVAAIESQVIEPQTARMCRRTVTVDGRRYDCSHPDLKRPLSAAEALAHSCNDFFVSLSPRLTRSAFNQVRTRLGLPILEGSADLAASFVGLAGPRITPRALLDVIARLAGVDAQRPVAVSDAARRTLLDGMRGAAQYGTASALGLRKIAALAKTGTAPMPGGAWMGLVVALEPADKPTRAVVVVAPGAAGVDAAAIAADVFQANGTSTDAPVLRSATAPTIRVGITGANGRLRATNLPLEDYIARVVTAEGQPRAPDEAQQALAITARTFALANLNRHRREGYDLCDSTHCQVMRTATDTARRAAAATAGRVLVYQGQPASVFYSALCGGTSELASEVWPGATNYSAASHDDDACEDEPGWTSEIRVDEIERALRSAGHRGDRLRDLRITSRNDSGRAATLRIDGFTPHEISGHDFRTAVGRVAGWQKMKSTAFEVRRVASGYRFTGRGFGHGVGLCVIGAGHRAAQGRSANEILRFYFPNLRIDSIASLRMAGTAASGPGDLPPVGGSAARESESANPSTASRERVAVPRPDVGAVASAKSASADIDIALPASEEVERIQVTNLVRGARDAIAAKAGVTSPAAIRVTVHPTVEAFARATGQPWWVSGATEGNSIDLLPLAMLRQRGQLERTVRHEIAHVLLDAALKGRPLWVREGAASYFADPGAWRETPARASCPADDEFLRPISAGAHRSAYARADACFARAIASGRRWQEVK